MAAMPREEREKAAFEQLRQDLRAEAALCAVCQAEVASAAQAA